VTQSDLLRLTVSGLETLGIPYFVVGSVASMSYGEPRMTRDIDLVIDLRANQIDAFCALYSDPDFYLSKSAILGAIRQRSLFNVIHTTSGNKLDFVLNRDDVWGREQMARRRRMLVLPGVEASVASPEDVILGKLWSYKEGESEKHLRDITGMLRISGNELDLAYLRQWATRLGVEEHWQRMLRAENDLP
jgi:hypothetical protein